jgi:hypothetical protein
MLIARNEQVNGAEVLELKSFGQIGGQPAPHGI